jgi:iron complex outermembrane receptor protein
MAARGVDPWPALRRGRCFPARSTPGDNENTFQLPGYVTVDAYLASHFRVKRTRVTPQVNFTNLLDKRYFLNTNVYDASPHLGIMPGQPFSVTGSIRWEY